MNHVVDRIRELGPWFHNLHLPDGTQTCPDHSLGDFPSFKWQELRCHIPRDLRGARVLDIGCNAGFYSIELARRGAQVLAIDVDEHYLRQARWAAGVFGVSDRVDFACRSVYELARTTERWDLVLCLGLLYHLRYPMLGLDIVSRCVRSQLIVQSLAVAGDTCEVPKDLDLSERERMNEPGWPRMSFVEHRVAGDPTNWWVPNHACLEAMLRSCGMRVIARPGDEFYICEPDPSSESNMWLWNGDEYRVVAGMNPEEAGAKRGARP